MNILEHRTKDASLHCAPGVVAWPPWCSQRAGSPQGAHCREKRGLPCPPQSGLGRCGVPSRGPRPVSPPSSPPGPGSTHRSSQQVCSTRLKLPGKHMLFFHSRPQRATVRGLHPMCDRLIPGRKRLMLRTNTARSCTLSFPPENTCASVLPSWVWAPAAWRVQGTLAP